MRRLVTTCLVAGALLATGCASKKYVRNTVAPVQAKVDQVGEQTTQNTTAIQDTRTELNKVDERAQAGISVAVERTEAAAQRAATADQHARDAMGRANQAAQSADEANRDLRQFAENIEDYKVETSATVLFAFNSAR